MAQYYAISKEEMEAVLNNYSNGCAAATRFQGEWVYQWPLAKLHTVMMQVYSSIAADSVAKRVGSDAIRVVALATGSQGKLIPLGKNQRVHRVAGWADNLRVRLDSATASVMAMPVCSACSRVMVQRVQGSTGQPFYGCIAYPECRQTRVVSPLLLTSLRG